MEAFFKAQGMKGAMLRYSVEETRARRVKLRRRTARTAYLQLEIEGHTLDADLAWHVRAWGWWVFREARKDLTATTLFTPTGSH